MSNAFKFLFARRHWFWLLMVAGLAGCAELPPPVKTADVHALQVALTSLAPTVREDEAGRVADCAYNYSRELAGRYRVVRPAIFQNFLVNTRARDRGLCYQWAEDILAKLQTFQLQSLELHWGIARANTAREHNCIVLTSLGGKFEDGIVLDAWRHSGRLAWSVVAKDKYPWVEGELSPTPATNSPATNSP